MEQKGILWLAIALLVVSVACGKVAGKESAAVNDGARSYVLEETYTLQGD